MQITADMLAERLQHAEERREAAIAAVQHWEGRAAAYRELLAEANSPAEPKPAQDSVSDQACANH